MLQHESLFLETYFWIFESTAHQGCGVGKKFRFRPRSKNEYLRACLQGEEDMHYFGAIIINGYLGAIHITSIVKENFTGRHLQTNLESIAADNIEYKIHIVY